MAAIDFDLQCSQCTGDLRGAELHGACPHCWADVADTVAVALIDPATHTVADDVPCIECGYNVRTLRLAANCPECGLAVLESVRPDDLHFASIRWLKRVRGGLTNLLLAFGAMGFVFLLVMAQALITITLAMRITAAGVWVFGLVMLITGVIRSTTCDPHPRTPRTVRVAGKIARVCCLLPVLWCVSLIFIGLGSASWVPAAVFGLVQFVVVFVGPICLCVCLRHVTIRGGRVSLRKLTTVLSRMIAAVGVLSIIGAVWTVMFPPIYGFRPTPPVPPDAWLDLLTGCYWAAFWILGISVLILGVVVLFKYRAMLSKAIARMPTQTEPRP